MHQSLATLDNPEFINLSPLDINPMMSQCEIKVFYVGKNRNHSFISKEVARDMAKTLRGAPIVGYYKEEKEDFRDHGHEVIIDDEGIKFNCKTVPYGFVSPNAKVWFQKFDETDSFGEPVTREYLMTTGYLWTGQFEECASALKAEGKNQSMELDDKTLSGEWDYDAKTNMEFFIINDAMISKLCMLGDDVEPCFEGARVTAPTVSSSFSLDSQFKNTLYSMMQDLKFALEGGTKGMEENQNLENVVEEFEVTETTEVTEPENTEAAAEVTETAVEVTEESVAEEFKKEDDEQDEDKKDDEDDNNNDDSNSDDNDDEDDKKKNFELEKEELQMSLNKLTASYQDLQKEFNALQKEFNLVMREKKEALIERFSMLSEEEKKDVVEHIDTYSYDDIEAKLSIIFTRSQVKNDSKSLNNTDNIIEAPMTYNLDLETSAPAWIQAVKRNKNNK